MRSVGYLLWLLVLLCVLPALAQDSLNIAQLGSITGWGFVTAVAVQDSLVFLGESDHFVGGEEVARAIHVINCADPHFLYEVGAWDVIHGPQDIVLDGRYAYVATGSGGLRVIDITNPMCGTEVGACPTDNAVKLVVRGGLAYVADDYSGLQVIDLTTPSNPVIVGHVPTMDRALNLAVSGGYAYVATECAGLTVVNISNPADPQVLALSPPVNRIRDVAVRGYYAYAAELDSGLSIIDIHDAAHPIRVGRIVPESSRWFWNVAINGQYLYVSDAWNGLRIYNLSNPLVPIEVNLFDPCSGPQDIAFAGPRAYVLDPLLGMYIADVSVPASSRLIGAYLPSCRFTHVSLMGNYAYAIAPWEGIAIFDLRQPAPPAMAGFYPMSSPNDVVIADSLAYVTTGSGRFEILSLRQPVEPQPLGNCAIISDAHVAVTSTRAYLAMGSDGLHIIDISNPASPAEVGIYPAGYYVTNVAVIGEYICIVDSVLRVLDTSDPADVRTVAIGDVYISPQDMTVSGNFVYIATYRNGLLVYDLTQPTQPLLTGTYDLTDAITVAGVCVQGDNAFLACHNRTGPANQGVVRVLDIHNPSQPVLTGFYETSGYASSIGVRDGIACLAAEWAFETYNCEAAISSLEPIIPVTPAVFALQPAYPNPFNAVTTLQLDVPHALDGRLVVYDLLGRQVTTLRDGLIPAGSQTIRWDAAGLASGNYFVRFESAPFTTTQKLLLLK